MGLPLSPLHIALMFSNLLHCSPTSSSLFTGLLHHHPQNHHERSRLMLALQVQLGLLTAALWPTVQ
ncbi:hypothetical protein GBA52_022179 [Prunus armeniaca]|nr:hypothetical protein GBA52_022179 [Prunus armeniaca]